MGVSLVACNSPPPPHHPEIAEEGGAFRPLTLVPPRPNVQVPLGDRQQLEDTLRDNNIAARRARVSQGYVEPTLPNEDPEPPMELPEDGDEQ